MLWGCFAAVAVVAACMGFRFARVSYAKPICRDDRVGGFGMKTTVAC